MKTASIDKLELLLRQNLHFGFSKDSLKCFETDSYRLNEGSSINKDQLFQTYNTRFKIQNDITHAQVRGYNELLQSLKNFGGYKARVMILKTDFEVYLIFTNEDISFLIGILKKAVPN